MVKYTFIQTEVPSVHNDWRAIFSVGYYDSNGKWILNSDHPCLEYAAERVAHLNSSTEKPKNRKTGKPNYEN